MIVHSSRPKNIGQMVPGSFVEKKTVERKRRERKVIKQEEPKQVLPIEEKEVLTSIEE